MVSSASLMDFTVAPSVSSTSSMHARKSLEVLWPFLRRIDVTQYGSVGTFTLVYKTSFGAGISYGQTFANWIGTTHPPWLLASTCRQANCAAILAKTYPSILLYEPTSSTFQYIPDSKCQD